VVLCVQLFNVWVRLVINSWSVLCRNWGDVVDIGTRLWTGWSGDWILSGTKDFSLLHDVQTGSGAKKIVLWEFHPTKA